MGRTEDAKNYTAEDRIKARNLYFQDVPIRRIAGEIDCSLPVVYKWKKQENWDELREKARMEALEVVYPSLVEYYSKKEQEYIITYQEALEKGREGLKKRDIKTAAEAFEIVDKSIKGQRGIATKMIHAQFIADIATILKEKIKDRDLLQDIVEDLKLLVVREYG